MSSPFPLPRLVSLCCVLIVLAACAPNSAATVGGADPASPLPTPDPNLAVYETAVRRDSKEQLIEDVVRVEYEIGEWNFVQDHWLNYALSNRADPTCILLQPMADPAEPDPPVSRTVPLGNRTWTVHSDQWSSGVMFWQLRYRNAPYEVALLMLYYVQPVTDASGRACIAAAEKVLSTFSLAPAARQPKTADEEVKPRVWLKSQEGATGEPILPDVGIVLAESADWQQFTSKTMGITFRYPPGWSIAGGEYFGGILLTSPDDDRGRRIWLTWLATEKPLDKPLRSWAEEYKGENENTLPGSVFDDALHIVDPGGTSEQVRKEYSAPFLGGAYLIAHGNLVLQVSTNSAWVDAPALLRAVASSIVFAEDAPTTLAEIPWR